MSTRTSPWPPGAPCWVDLMTPDVVAAGRFYAEVLGWEVPEPDAARGGYAVAHVGGAAVAGIGPEREGARRGWTLSFATHDAEATLAAVAEHGGTVLSPVLDVDALGRTAVAVDPAGAVFGLWQSGTFLGTQLVGEPGALAWHDLRSTDPAAATAFYAEVLGVTVTPLAMAGPDYGTFSVPGLEGPSGGIGGMMGADGSSHWLVYLGVADADAAVEAALAAGGSVTMPVKDTAFGRIAGLVDPFGAELVVHQGTTQPPRREV